jgi:hypothetical protein
MKKYEIKALAYWFTFLLLLLAMTSCRTKQVDSSKSETIKQHEILEQVEKNNVVQIASEKEVNEKHIEELKEVISSLNINFEGKTLEDKLDVLLKRTPEGGTKLSFSGVGSASFKQDEKIDIARLEMNLMQRQDSLFVQLLNELWLKQELLNKMEHSKDKNIKSRGFKFGAYFIFGFIVLFLVLVWRVYRKFTPFI